MMKLFSRCCKSYSESSSSLRVLLYSASEWKYMDYYSVWISHSYTAEKCLLVGGRPKRRKCEETAETVWLVHFGQNLCIAAVPKVGGRSI